MRATLMHLKALQPQVPRQLIATWFVSVAAALLEAAVLLVLAGTLLALSQGDEGITFGDLDFSVVMATGVALVGAAAVLGLHGLESALVARLEASVLGTGRHQALSDLLASQPEWQERQGEGTLAAAVNTYAVLAGVAASSMAGLLASATSLLVILATAALVDFETTILVLLAGLLFGLLMRPLARSTRRWSARSQAVTGPLNDAIGQSARMGREIQAFGVAEPVVATIDGLLESSHRALRGLRWSTRFAGLAYRDLALVFLLLGVLVAALASQVDLAPIATVGLLILRSLVYGQQAQSARHQLAAAAPGAEALTRLVEDASAHRRPLGEVDIAAVHDVRLAGVDYEYRDGRIGVSGVHLCMDEGEVLAVSGPSGSGKTTLVEVIIRQRNPTSGEVLINGTPADRITADSWHRQVAFVPQHAGLISGSVMDNVRFFRSWISDEDALSATAAARIDEDIAALPDGFNSRLGPGGVGLSVGQRQRLAIARALAGNPSLLVLDEPTSALDGRSRDLICESIDSLGSKVTVVLVSHDPRVLELADRRFHMVDGTLETVPTAASNDGTR